MRAWHKTLLALLGVGLVLAWAGAVRPAQAQAGPTLESLEIEVWPEFDRPSALVLIHGVLPATASLPFQVSVRLPKTGQLNATAYEDATGALLASQSTVTAEGDWQRVTFPVQSLSFRIEYYDADLVIQGQARSLAFQWPADYAAKTVNVRIQEPLDTQGWQVEPAFILLGARDFGLNYYGRDYGAVPVGAPIAFTLQYTKTSTTLSQSAVAQPTTAVSIDTSTPIAGSSDLTPWLIGLGVVGGLAVLGGAGWFVWSRWPERKPAPRPRPRSHRTAPAPPPAGGPPAPATNRFCTQCGQPIRAGDQFCRNCGGSVRD